LEQGIALYDPQEDSPLVSAVTQDPGVSCLSVAAFALWHLGYPDQARKRSHEALTLARELARPYGLAFTLSNIVMLHQFCREVQAVQEQAEAVIALCTEQGFALFLAWGSMYRGWALVVQGQQREEGIMQMRQGLAAVRATGAELFRPFHLSLLAETYGDSGQIEEGLAVLAEALDAMNKTGEHFWEAELHRLKGTLTLQSKVQGPKSKVEKEAEECFLKAIEIARRQSAKSLELRAVISLSRLWKSQDKKEEARQLLAEIYGWFTEGFDTADLKEAKALLDELA